MPSPIDRHLRIVRRRLFLQSLLHILLRSWTIALLLAAGWFLVRPLGLQTLGDTVRWSVPAALIGVATLAAIVIAFINRPSRVSAALALDERCGLRERVTTLLTLRPDQLDSPPAHTLRSDVEACLLNLDVARQFPLSMSWPQATVPLGALVLAVAACFFDPLLGGLRFPTGVAQAAPSYELRQIQDQLDNIRKVSTETKPEQPKSKELEELEAEWQKLLEKPLDLKDQDKVRERVGEFRKLEDKMKDRLENLKDRAEKTSNLKKELEKLAAEPGKLQEGPAKDFEEALSKGDFKKAQEVLQKLREHLKDDKLSRAEQQKMAEQFREVQEKLKRLLDENEPRRQAKKDFEDGKIDQQELDREMERMGDLQGLSEVLDDLAKNLKGGKGGGEALEQALDKLKKLELSEDEFNELIKKLRAGGELDEEMKALLMACECDGDCQRNGMGQGRRPGGKRPIGDDPDTKPKNERQKVAVDPKGQQRITGFVRGGHFTKVPARAVDGAFQQAVQDAPDAIDRQRIPDDAADLARSYFDRLGKQ